jgi:hypothetical protein
MSKDRNIQALEGILRWAKFGEAVSIKLCGVRHAHESDEQTLDRIIEMSRKIVCNECRGHKYDTMDNNVCRKCRGTGEKAYDPFLPIVKEVMNA